MAKIDEGRSPFRKPNDAAPIEVNVLLMDGGLGDNVARLSAVRSLLREYPHATAWLWAPDYFLEWARACVPNIVDNPARCRPMPFSQYGLADFYKPELAQKATPAKDQVHTSLKTHLVEHAFTQLLDRSWYENERLEPYVAPANADATEDERALYKSAAGGDYVVVTTGFTASVRQWVAPEVNRFVRMVKEQRGLNVVFLGKRQTVTGVRENIEAAFDDRIDYSAGLDMRDKTSLIEARKIMQGARAVVGIDNGLLHIAWTTKTPVVAGFTSVRPEDRVPPEAAGRTHVVYPGEKLACRGCQSRMELILGHDFRLCYYKDYACVLEMHAEKFLAGIPNE